MHTKKNGAQREQSLMKQSSLDEQEQLGMELESQQNENEDDGNDYFRSYDDPSMNSNAPGPGGNFCTELTTDIFDHLFVSPPPPFRSKGSIQSGYADATNWPLTVDAESSPKGYRSIFECIPQQVYRLRAARRSYQFGRFATIHSRRISHIEPSMKHNNNYIYKIRY